MYRAFRYQLRCKPEQERALRRFAGGLRWLWNQALAEQQARHARGEPYASYVDMAKWLTTWRNTADTAWLSQSPVHTQQQVLKRLDESYRRFFKAVRDGKTARIKPPRFKAHGDDPSLRFPDAKQIKLDAVNGRIFCPKLGWLRLRLSREVSGDICNVTITRTGERWYASIQTEFPDVVPSSDLVPTLGIDLGLAQFATGSDGHAEPALKALTRQRRRLAHLQRCVSRKVKGSRNRKKAICLLGNLHRRIAHQRADWLHQMTTFLAQAHPVIAMEDLKVANMSASAKGTVGSPGKNVRQKSGLNRGILDAAWSEFRRQLDYKLQGVGGELVVVPPAYTSQCCSACSHTDAGNRASQASFKCLVCGHTENADVNAAKNILRLGTDLWTGQHAQHQVAGDATKTTVGHTDGVQVKDAPSVCGGEVRRAMSVKTMRAAPVKQKPAEGLVHG